MVARGVPATLSRSGVFPACGAVSAANDRDGASSDVPGAKTAWFKDTEGNILAIVQDVRRS